MPQKAKAVQEFAMHCDKFVNNVVDCVMECMDVHINPVHNVLHMNADDGHEANTCMY